MSILKSMNEKRHFSEIFEAKEEIIGYTAKGDKIVLPKTKKAQEKAYSKVQDEADKFAKSTSGGEVMMKLFLRLMMQVKSEKEAQKIIKGLLGAQKSSNPPYVKVKGIHFTIPNFEFKGGVLGDEKTVKEAKYNTNPFPQQETKYRVIYNVADKLTEIHAATDVVMYNDYTKKYKKDIKIFIYLVHKGDGTFPSDLRLANAAKKLQDKGFNVELIGELDDDTRSRVFGDEGK